MIRARTTQNEVKTLPEDTKFVEILDEEGNLGIVLYEDAAGMNVFLVPDDEMFKQYCKMFGITKFAEKSKVVRL